MSKDSILESRSGKKTGHPCKEWRIKPSGRCPGSVYSKLVRIGAASSAPTEGKQRESHAQKLSLSLLVLSLVWIGPILACGSFQPRPTPTRQPPVSAPVNNTPVPDQPAPTALPTQPPAPTDTPIPPPTPTLTIRNPLTIGEQARIIIPGGLNIREQPTVGAPVITLLAQGKRILVLAGPTTSEGYIWWKVNDNQGNVGWIASGQQGVDWISPQVGEVQAVNRPPIIGDRVVVTLRGELSVRALPGVTSVIVARARTNERYDVVAGPQAAGGYFWYQIRSDDGQVEGWAADGSEGERWLSPLE